jgi:peptidoglycan/xylan/chitin deacetylase (PgdA/CDA1 family)
VTSPPRLDSVPPIAPIPPVLCYHQVGGPLRLGVTRVSESVFVRQMETLARKGWRALRLAEFAERVAGSGSAHDGARSFLLSFDDGYASLATHAYPVLADLGFTATTFLIADYVGKANTWDVRYTWPRLVHLDWDAVERWQARGFDFGSHTATHPRLTWLEDARVLDELSRSRETLRARLGASAARAVAYPFGASDERVERLAHAAGYELGFGGAAGGGAGGGVRGNRTPMNLSRVPVYVWDVGSEPFALRDDRLGALARLLAHAANRCAVGTSILKGC